MATLEILKSFTPYDIVDEQYALYRAKKIPHIKIH